MSRSVSKKCETDLNIHFTKKQEQKIMNECRDLFQKNVKRISTSVSQKNNKNSWNGCRDLFQKNMKQISTSISQKKIVKWISRSVSHYFFNHQER